MSGAGPFFSGTYPYSSHTFILILRTGSTLLAFYILEKSIYRQSELAFGRSLDDLSNSPSSKICFPLPIELCLFKFFHFYFHVFIFPNLLACLKLPMALADDPTQTIHSVKGGSSLEEMRPIDIFKAYKSTRVRQQFMSLDRDLTYIPLQNNVWVIMAYRG
jgi:hypothetical protein